MADQQRQQREPEHHGHSQGQAVGPEQEKAKAQKLDVTFKWERENGKGSCTIPVQYEGIEGDDALAVVNMCGQVAAAIEGFQGTAGPADEKITVSLTWKGTGPNKDHEGSAKKTGLKYSQAGMLEGFALDGLRRLLDMGTMEVGQGIRA